MTSNGSDSTPSLDRRAVCSNEESLASNAGLALLWSAPCSLNGILPITLVDKDSVGVVVSERSNQVSSVLGFGGPTAPSTLRLSLLTSDIGRTEGLDCIHRIRQLLRTKTRTWMPFVRRRRSTHQQCSDLWQEMAGTSLANKNRGEKLRPRVASILKSALKSNRWGGTLPNKAKMTPGNCLQALYPKGGQKYPRPKTARTRTPPPISRLFQRGPGVVFTLSGTVQEVFGNLHSQDLLVTPCMLRAPTGVSGILVGPRGRVNAGCGAPGLFVGGHIR